MVGEHWLVTLVCSYFICMHTHIFLFELPTDFLVIGEDPSKSRINEARKRQVHMITLSLLQRLLSGELPSLNELKREATI